jgi:tetratricopeptide (TPR) repeat protein
MAAQKYYPTFKREVRCMFDVRRHTRWPLWAMLYVGVVVNPAGAQGLKCFILTPPEQLLEGVKQIAIADFGVTSHFSADDAPGGRQRTVDKILGAIDKANEEKKNKDRFADAGSKLADLMIAELLEKDRGVHDVGSGFLGLGKKEGKTFQTGAYTNIFNVVERSQFQRVLEELQLGQSGVVNEATAAQVGQVLGVDAMLIGAVNVSVQDTWVKETREDKNKNKYEVDCEKLVANVGVTVRFVNVETGQVIGSTDSRQKSEDKKCKGDYGNLPTPEAAVDKCLHAAARELVDYFTPRFKEQKIEFAKIEGEEYKRSVETAKRALSDYDLNSAYVQVAAIAEQDPYNDAAIYNLGALHEVVGNYSKAKEQYTLAYNLKSREDKYRDALKRITKQTDYWSKLNALGIALQEYQFQASSEEMAVATSARVETNGPRATRYEIKTDANPGSETVARVPGEIELQLLETVSGWYKVRLPDGKEGFLPQASAKVIK